MDFSSDNRDMRHFNKFIALFLVLSAFSAAAFALEVYKDNGTASFYGADFHGKKTSNGETFDMNGYTCANKVLPFDTILKVTNLDNDKSVEVRVNDRGPFVLGRDIDLSTQAAKDLGMVKNGLADVKIEIVKLGPATKLSSDTATAARKLMLGLYGKLGEAEVEDYVAKKTWDIQVATFSEKETARKFAKRLYDMGFTSLVFQTSTKTGLVRVVVARISDDDLQYTQDKLTLKGFSDCIVRERTAN